MLIKRCLQTFLFARQNNKNNNKIWSRLSESNYHQITSDRKKIFNTGADVIDKFGVAYYLHFAEINHSD